MLSHLDFTDRLIPLANEYGMAIQRYNQEVAQIGSVDEHDAKMSELLNLGEDRRVPQ